MIASSKLARRSFFLRVFFNGTIGLALWARSESSEASVARVSAKVYLPVMAATEDRPDLALETSLWRSAFTAEIEKPNDGKAANSATFGQSAGSVGLDAAESLFEDTAAPGLEETIADFLEGSKSSVVLSEWEQAVCNSTGLHGKKLTLDGPSAVSVVVAVVGAVVVCGSYLQSGRKS